MPRSRVLGAVLAGGASSRFGSDKAVALVGGTTLLEHACAALRAVTDEVVVVGRAGGVPDRPMPGLGPLGGIAGALDHATRHGFCSVLTTGCDMPAVPVSLLEALLTGSPSYCSDAPVLGHWPVSLLADLTAHLARNAPSPRPRAGVQGFGHIASADPAEPWMPGQARHFGSRRRSAGLSVRRWAESVAAIGILSPIPLANINTPADLPAS